MSDWNITPSPAPRRFATTRSYWEIETSPELSDDSTAVSSLSLDTLFDTIMERNNQRRLPINLEETPREQTRDNRRYRPPTPGRPQRRIRSPNEREEQQQPENNQQGEEQQQQPQQQQEHNQQGEEQQQHESDAEEQGSQSDDGSDHLDEFLNQQGDNPQDDMARFFVNLTRAMQRMNRPNDPIGRETRLVEISTFGGGEQDPLTWLYHFYDACIANNISEARRLDILPVYLKGIAYAWWMDVGRTITQWQDNTYPRRSFVHRFKEKWCTTHQKSRWMNQLRNRIQRAGETVDEYWNAIVELYQRVDPDRHYPMEDRMQQFVNGLRDELREPVEISIPHNIEEALNRARAVESTFSKNAPLSAYSMTRTNKVVDNELQDIKAVLTQLTQGFQQLATQQVERKNTYSNNRQQETRTCNKCGRIGHIARNCRSGQSNNQRVNTNNNGNNRRPNNNNNGRNNRNCFICNQPGHIAINCPQRNQQQSTGNGNNNQNQWMNASMGDFLETAKQVKESLN